MKLFYSPTSPFVRKVLVCAHELGLNDKIERLKSSPHPVRRDAAIVEVNPLGQVPTLLTHDKIAIFDSRSICEYLDGVAGGNRLFPAHAGRWTALSQQAAADGLLGAAVNSRYEVSLRNPEARSADWLDSQMAKIRSGLDYFAREAESFQDRIDIGTISVGCALGYLDLRFQELEWRKSHPTLGRWFAAFDDRQSMKATIPQG